MMPALNQSVTKHLTLLGHRMTRIFPILLFIGLAWGQSETDTPQIDYYEKGVIAAKKDFSSYYSCFAVCTFTPPTIKSKHNPLYQVIYIKKNIILNRKFKGVIIANVLNC